MMKSDSEILDEYLALCGWDVGRGDDIYAFLLCSVARVRKTHEINSGSELENWIHEPE